MAGEKIITHASAVLLISSSIALAFLQVLTIDDIAYGTLMYIAQAFLLAGSLFGLDYYVKKLTYIFTNYNEKKHDPEGNPKQQPVKHQAGEHLAG